MIDAVSFLCLLADGKQRRLERHCYGEETLCEPILLFFTFLELNSPMESVLSGVSIWHHFALSSHWGRIKMDPSYVFLLWTKLQKLRLRGLCACAQVLPFHHSATFATNSPTLNLSLPSCNQTNNKQTISTKEPNNKQMSASCFRAFGLSLFSITNSFRTSW